MNVTPNSSPILSSSSLSIPTIAMTLSTLAEKANPEKKARCSAADCKKKLSAVDFDCRCGHRFCGAHRQAEDHKCTHNWKADGTRVLGQQLQSCVNQKLEKL
jgi:curli biogenesis system outer membrane secretion channel CsgG